MKRLRKSNLLLSNSFLLLLFSILHFPFSVLSAQNVAVIVPESLQNALMTWVKYRTAQGYTVHVIPSGKSFNRDSLPPNLSAVFLAGSSRLIPSPRFGSILIQHFSEENHFASDDWYADRNNDGVPDCPVGRFPVDTPEELSLLIQKTIRYETQIQPGPWCRRIQAVAGIGNFSPVIDNVIESAVRYILTQTVPNSWDIALLHAHWQSPFCPAPLDFQTELTATLNRGTLFWCYMGHGNHRQLDPLTIPDGRLPTIDAEHLPVLCCRDTMPIMLLLCCYGGTLDAATRSLAEEFVLQKEGPVAAVAASRTTMPYGMSIFGLELLHTLFEKQEQGLTLGQLVWETKYKVLFPKKDGQALRRPTTEAEVKKTNRRPVREMLDTLAKSFDPFPDKLAQQRAEQTAMFNLFGDPLLKLPIPKQIQLTAPARTKAGTTVSLTGTVPDGGIKAVHIELVPAVGRISLQSPRRKEYRQDAETQKQDNEEYRRSNEQAVFSHEVPVSAGTFTAEIPVPENVFGDYVFRAFGSTEQNFAMGSVGITVRLVKPARE
ncbi:MAG: C25 family cysteine peptidase [Planctomycetaceae bacterium]|jgi:hypothetical protein|nr:C25 family cysteine peptidase [Planctomycetaceae bacterium]